MKKALVFLVLALILVGSSQLALAKSEVEQAVGFRGDLAHTGVYDTEGVPVFHGLKWKFKTSGVIASSPTIADGVAYIGSDDTYLYAVELAKGKEKWRFKTQGPIKSTPVVKGDLVFISSRDGYLYAVNTRNGKLVWKYQTEQEDKRKDPWDFYQSSPIVYQDLVFFGGWDGYFYGLKVETGELVQKYHTGRTHSTPTIAQGKLIVGTMADSLSAFDLATGEKVWTVEESISVFSSIVYQDGFIYVGVRHGECMQAFDVETGELAWKFVSPYGSWIQSTPALAHNVLYSGTSDDLKVYAIDALTGGLIWEAYIGDTIHSSPAYTRGVIYFATGDNYGMRDTGEIYALDARSGNKLWSYEIYGISHSSPVIHEGVLYVGSNDGYLYAIY